MESGEFRWTGTGFRFVSDSDRARALDAMLESDRATLREREALAGAAEQKRDEFRRGITEIADALQVVADLWTPRLRTQPVVIARKAEKKPSQYSSSKPAYKFNDLHYRPLPPAIQVSTYHKPLVSAVSTGSTYDIGVDANGRIVQMWRPLAGLKERPRTQPATFHWPPSPGSKSHWLFGYRQLVADDSLDDPEVGRLTGLDILAIYNHLLLLADRHRVTFTAPKLSVRAGDYQPPAVEPPRRGTVEYHDAFKQIARQLFEVPGLPRRRFVTSRVRFAPYSSRNDWKNWEIRWVETEPVIQMKHLGVRRDGTIVTQGALDWADRPAQRKAADHTGYGRLVEDRHLPDPAPRGAFSDQPGPSVADLMDTAVDLCRQHGIALPWHTTKT